MEGGVAVVVFGVWGAGDDDGCAGTLGIRGCARFFGVEFD